MKAIKSEILGSHDHLVISEEFIEIGNYTDYYKHLKCELFTVVVTHFRGHELSIFVDDEAVLKQNYGREVENYPEPLFGNMVIAGGVDEEGNTKDIPDDIKITDMQKLISYIKYETKGYENV